MPYTYYLWSIKLPDCSRFLRRAIIILSISLLVSSNDPQESYECSSEMYVERKAGGASAHDRDAMILHAHIRHHCKYQWLYSLVNKPSVPEVGRGSRLNSKCNNGPAAPALHASRCLPPRESVLSARFSPWTAFRYSFLVMKIYSTCNVKMKIDIYVMSFFLLLFGVNWSRI